MAGCNGFKQLVSSNVKLQSHESRALIPCIVKAKCVLWVSSNWNLLDVQCAQFDLSIAWNWRASFMKVYFYVAWNPFLRRVHRPTRPSSYAKSTDYSCVCCNNYCVPFALTVVAGTTQCLSVPLLSRNAHVRPLLLPLLLPLAVWRLLPNLLPHLLLAPLPCRGMQVNVAHLHTTTHQHGLECNSQQISDKHCKISF